MVFDFKFLVLLAASSVAELSDLALYLTKQLRTNNVSTLLLPSSFRSSLEYLWKQYDELGIPYNVLLNEKTLKDGLVSLRSRDTTLKVSMDANIFSSSLRICCLGTGSCD